MKRIIFLAMYPARLILGLVALSLWITSATTAGSNTPAQESASNSLAHLALVMDQYHGRFPVYDDISSAGDHFYAYSKIPDQNAAVKINGSFTTNPHSGATAVRCEFINATGNNFGGFYFLNGLLPSGAQAPLPNFGETPNAGINLSGATSLCFWARGETGQEKVEFFMGGVGRNPATGNPEQPYPDSTPVVKIQVPLTPQWTRYCLDLSGKDLSYVLGGFGWVANAPNNPTGAVFYLDDIQYELDQAHRAARLNEPHFLRSFTTEPFQTQPEPVGMFDLVFRNTAFTYDNALALLAFLSRGTTDDVLRAKRIGDAFVYASQHDRFYDDGRLRDAYMAGDISLPPGWTPNGRVGTVPVSGYFDEGQQKFFEIEQGGISTGNNAWAMIALLALYQRTPDPSYLTTARALGKFIHTFRNDTGKYQGFQGGFDNPETNLPIRRLWASTEHNLDVFAAFTVMFQITGETVWQNDAQHARQFIGAMWNADEGCYLAGTTDTETRNTLLHELPVDVQAWSVLVLPDALTLHPQTLACPEEHHRLTHDGFSGFDFNDDRDGVWFEGTGHMATAYAVAGQLSQAESLRQELQRAQQTPPFGDGQGMAAACHDGVTTGFGFLLFRRLHIAATAWNAFAQLGFNPYYQTTASVDNHISGMVKYGNSPTTKPVPGVTLTVTGASSTVIISDSSGNYNLTGLGGGPYTVTPSKSGDVNGISALDASLVAQHVAGLITLTANQQIAGDASGNGTLSAFDASLIAQAAAGIPNAGIAGTWKFVPSNRTYPTLSGNLINQNYDAVLVGEVTGNWTPPASGTSPESQSTFHLNQVRSESEHKTLSNATPATISRRPVAGAHGANVTIPIRVGDLSGRQGAFQCTATFQGCRGRR